ncbi:uncharacterized protein LOC101461170 [Ceratitis capitata]|uniref:Uncharacterized protein n=1 Tax=Ceratitis capitata TaxID=7213 RepID=W8BU49_CERCA|nr:uncharacterized protein LOC101461170 [Ceratitis capitata]
MSKVIEISDSDDENEKFASSIGAAPAVTLPLPSNRPTNDISNLAKEKSNVIPKHSVSPSPMVISEVASLNATSMPTIVSVQGGADAASGATTTPTTSPQSAKIAQPNKRNRRKSMHHPLCVSPEIEFETIALEDDEENASTKEKTKIHTNTEVVQQQNKSPKSHKTVSNNLNSQVNPPASSNEKEFRDACSELLKSERTIALLRQVAEDRVRINFLLASYNMAEIHFSVHTKLEVLQTQLNERMKRRKWQQERKRKRLYRYNPRAET